MHSPSFYSQKKKGYHKNLIIFFLSVKTQSKNINKSKTERILTKSHQQLKFLLIWLMV